MELITAIYLIGVLVAYFQLHHWMRDKCLSKRDYQYIVILSMASWLVYPIYFIEYLYENINDK